MKKRFAALCIFSLLFASSLSAQQIYKWKDEKGQWRFGQNPPPGVETEQQKGSAGFRSTKLGRSYAGFSLGESAESFLKHAKIDKQKTDDSGMQFFLITKENLPVGADHLIVTFFNGRLAFMTMFFPGSFIKSTGGWDSIVNKTSEKYGPPDLRQVGTALWVDAETALRLNLRVDGGISADYGDRSLMDQHSTFQKKLAPSF